MESRKLGTIPWHRLLSGYVLACAVAILAVLISTFFSMAWIDETLTYKEIFARVFGRFPALEIVIILPLFMVMGTPFVMFFEKRGWRSLRHYLFGAFWITSFILVIVLLFYHSPYIGLAASKAFNADATSWQIDYGKLLLYGLMEIYVIALLAMTCFWWVAIRPSVPMKTVL